MISFGVLGVLFTYFLFDKLGQTQDYWVCILDLFSRIGHCHRLYLY